jgi:cystathionine beta-synthase
VSTASTTVSLAELRRTIVHHQRFASRFRRARPAEVEAEIRQLTAVQLDSLTDVIGALYDRDLLERVFRNPDALHEDVASAMQPPLAAVDASQSVDDVFETLTTRGNAVVVARAGRPVGVLTRSDLLEFLAHTR